MAWRDRDIPVPCDIIFTYQNGGANYHMYALQHNDTYPADCPTPVASAQTECAAYIIKITITQYNVGQTKCWLPM